MKWIEQANPFVAGGISRYRIIRETKTQYVCEHNVRFHKPKNDERDGCPVKMVGGDLWDHFGTLRVKAEGGT